MGVGKWTCGYLEGVGCTVVDGRYQGKSKELTVWCVQDEFENILHERAVIANLNKLDDLISDAQKRKSRSSSTDSAPIPYVSLSLPPLSLPFPPSLSPLKYKTNTNRPHTLPAASLLLAHTTPLHQSQQSLLNAKLQTTESQNATLIEEVRRQRKEIEALLMLGEGVVRDLEGAGGRLAERGGELAREGREAEGVLGGS